MCGPGTDEIWYRALSLRVLAKVMEQRVLLARQSSAAFDAHAFALDGLDPEGSLPELSPPCSLLMMSRTPPPPPFWEPRLEEAQRCLPGEVRRAGAESRIQRGLSGKRPGRAK